MQLIYVSVAFLVVTRIDENNHTMEHYLRFLNVSSKFIGSYLQLPCTEQWWESR